ncbi:MAG: hypothetical protein HY885_05765 [Deltaproteobacteria bacterium]|nr:hypothetical protein [Deltaproteobacteria bacterium]
MTVIIALVALLSQSFRQYQLYHEHEAIISQTESLIFQFSIIREHVADAMLDNHQPSKLTGISAEMEKLNSNLTAVLEDKEIRDEYKLTFLNSIDLPGIILLLRKIESGTGEKENIRNLNSEMRTLSERLILFDRVLVNNAKQKLISFQNVIIGTAAFVVFLLVGVLTLFHRQLVIPLLQLISKSSGALSGGEETIQVSTSAREVANLTAVFSDLLRQRRDLHGQLQAHREAIMELTTSLKGFLAIISTDGVIIDVSSGITEKCRFNPGELTGRSWRNFFIMPQQESDRDLSDEQLLENLSSVCLASEMSLATKDMNPIPHIRCSFINLARENHEPPQVYCMGIDLSEEQTQIDELKRSLVAEKNKKTEMVRISHLAVLGEIATGVAHEVGNLSNGIINYAQVLADSACDPDFEIERDKLFKKIILEGEKIAGLAKNLLAYGQDDAQSRELVPVEEVLRNSLALMSHYFRIDGTRVETNFATIAICKINGRQMQQVFLSVLNNARRALNERYPQKDEKKILRISANEIEKNGKKMTKMTFTDYGIGITPENLKRVFDPSFSTKPAAEGVGMGLTVSRELIDLHNGNIYLESQANEQTTVTIELPAN